VLGMVSNVLVILLLNHFVACGWYSLGKHGTTSNWIAGFGFQNASAPYVWATAYHWSLTQFTPASMHVQPQNFAERIYTIITLVCAMCTFTSFIGSITSRMSTLRALASKKEKDTCDLYKYFRRHQISRELRNRIILHVNLASETDTTINTASVLSRLSFPLALELRHQLFDKYLTHNHVFKELNYKSPALVQALCRSAITSFELSPSDAMFAAGDPATAMYFITRGKMVYCLQADDVDPELVEMGDWCSEASLWTTWIHVGKLQAKHLAEVIAVSAQHFRTEVHKFPALIAFIKKYATTFVMKLNESANRGDDNGPRLSDLHHGHASKLHATRRSQKHAVAKENRSHPIFRFFPAWRSSV